MQRWSLLIAVWSLLSYQLVADGLATIGSGRRCAIVVQSRPILPFQALSPKGWFMIHYDTVGSNGVRSLDRDGNGVPDYIDTVGIAFDSAWTFLVARLRFPSPPLDSGKWYAVYVQDLGQQGLYGKTVLEQYIGPGGTTGRYRSFIIVDNNYSSDDSLGGSPVYATTGMAALRITAVHEFFHAIQIGCYGNYPDQQLFHEMSSSWAEIRAYPQILDFLQYAQWLVLQPQRIPLSEATNAFAGYAYGLFAWYCTMQTTDSLIRWMWEYRLSTESFFDALQQSLQRVDHDFQILWCQFVQALLFSGRSEYEDSLDIPYISQLPKIQPAETYHISSDQLISGELFPIEFRFLRFLIPRFAFLLDTLDVAVSAADIEAANQALNQTVHYRLIVTPGMSRVTVSFSPAGRTGCIAERLMAPKVYPVPYPQPFIRSRHTVLYFPLPQLPSSVRFLRFEVFSVAMQKLWSQDVQPVVIQQTIGIRWDGMLGEQRIAPGVYLYRIVANGIEQWGKFVVQP